MTCSSAEGRRRRAGRLGLAALLLAAVPAAAVLPVGGEVAVNAYTAGDQAAPAVAPLGSGFVVAWESDEQDESDRAVVARRFTAAGAAAGGEIVVNLQRIGDQLAADVAAVGGGFVVAWQGYVSEANEEDIFARLFDGAGKPLTDELPVAASGTVESTPAVAGGSDGFIVAFARAGQSDSDVVLRRYSAAGAAGPEVVPHTVVPPLQLDPDVARAADGRAVVVWQSLGQDAGSWGVFARRYAATGAPVESVEWQVPFSGSGSQTQPAVAMRDDGTFLVAWNDFGRDGSDDGIFAQAFDAAGARVGAEQQINQTTAGRQSFPTVSTIGSGYAVGWRASEGDGSGSAVFARRLDAAGAPLTGELRLNLTTEGNQSLPALAATAAGAVAVWQDPGADGLEIKGRLLLPGGAALCVAGETTLCLGDGRFRITADWRTPAGATGTARVVQLTPDTGYLWFFAESNVEVVLKVLDGCGVNGHHWFFAGGLTNVAVTILVEDTATGESRTYQNPLSTAFQPLQDTAAFGCP